MTNIPMNDCSKEQMQIEELVEKCIKHFNEGWTMFTMSYCDVVKETAEKVARLFLQKGYYAYQDYNCGRYLHTHIAKVPQGDSLGRMVSRRRIY